jgi:hypothetical protein
MGNVSLTNSYSSKIYVAYMRLDRACGADCGDPWDVLGWINLQPGQSQTRPNPTGNRWYYYAEADDGAFWAGPFDAEVSWERFEKCTCLGVSVSDGPNPWHMVGMRELDLGKWGGVNFVG